MPWPAKRLTCRVLVHPTARSAELLRQPSAAQRLAQLLEDGCVLHL
jgi:hypothetical protein